MEISPLLERELKEAIDLIALCFGEDMRPYAIEDFGATFERASYVPKTFAARLDDKIVGLIQSVNGYIAPNVRAFAWVATAPAHRRKGIATNLIAYAEQEAVKNHFKGDNGTFIIHSSINPAFYQTMGYIPGSTTYDGHPFMVKYYIANQ